jgi:hypothetical protein
MAVSEDEKKAESIINRASVRNNAQMGSSLNSD